MSKYQEEKSKVYSALEVANICGVVNQTAINWIRNNHLKAFKTPGGQFRVYPDDLAEFMQKRSMIIPEDVLNNCKKRAFQDEDIKILIVDDDKGFNDLIFKSISAKFEKASVAQAFDGFEAGTMMVSKQPKCLILDLNLPGIDGIKLYQRLKSSDAFGHPEVIVVTGMNDEETEKKCRELGVKYFFRKPVFIPELIKVITTIFN